jgi:hypothetical protein
MPNQVIPEADLGQRRERALLLARPRWTETTGILLLAPPYPRGGINGDHLVYVWRDDGVAYALSLHAWRPLREATATLRAVVESIRR